MAVSLVPKSEINLASFRRRILLLASWRMAAVGGCIGCAAAIIAIVADRFDLIDLQLRSIIALVIGGIVLGICVGLARKYSDTQIARSIDRRSGLDDRLTTLYEFTAKNSANDDGFLGAVASDTAPRIISLKPSALFPLKLQRIHGALLAMCVVCGVAYLALETPLLRPLSSRLEAAELKREAVQVQAVAKPFLAEADKPGASSDEKQLSHDIKRFMHDLNKGHMTKQEALIKANQLFEQAQHLEASRNLALSKSVEKAQTAGAKLQQMMQAGSLQKTEAAKLADQERAVQNKLQQLQNQLNAAKAGKSGSAGMSKAKQDAIQQQIDALQKQLQQIQLSEKAQETFAKLSQMKEFQEAMKLLSQLQQMGFNSGSNSSQQQLTPEQLKQIAARLEQLAKSLDTDAKMHAYAQALLAAAMQAKMGNQAGLGVAIGNAMGMGSGNSPTNQPGNGLDGQGGTNPGVWEGGRGHIHMSDKSSLLHLNFQDRIITSQKGNGPSSYTEELGPAQLTNKSGVPYQSMLPKYEKSAESTLSKGDIPPEMRTKVRDYFDSLHQGQ